CSRRAVSRSATYSPCSRAARFSRALPRRRPGAVEKPERLPGEPLMSLRDKAASARDVPRLELVGAGGPEIQFSPYRVFSREQWAKLRADTPMTLEPEELEVLSGILDTLSMEEVETIYLPLSRLLNLYVAA